MAESSSNQPVISFYPVITGQSGHGSSWRTSCTTNDFTSSTKHAIEATTITCWACESAGRQRIDHAHVVAKTDVFEILEEMEILDFQISNAIENGIMLCTLCHPAFDDHLNPVWVFYPSDLNYFIQFELADRKYRMAHSRPRRVPNFAAYLRHQKNTTHDVPENAEFPLYVRHVLKPEDSITVRQIHGKKGWHGHPIAAIRSAWRALGALRGNRIPSEDRAQLSYLLDLYRTPLHEHVVPPIGLPRLPSQPPPSDDQNPDDDTGEGKGKGKQVQKRGTKRPAPAETQKTLAGQRSKREGAGVRKKKTQPLRESAVASEIKKQEPTNIMHWLNEIEDRTPPTSPPTPVRK